MKKIFKVLFCFALILLCIPSIYKTFYSNNVMTKNVDTVFANGDGDDTENTEGEQNQIEEQNLGRQINASEIKDLGLRNHLTLLLAEYFPNTVFYENIFMYTDITEIKYVNRETKIKTLEGLELFNFGKITSINFSKNEIYTIPQDAFKSMVNLEYLNLSNNLLTSLNLELYCKTIDLTNNLLNNLSLRDSKLDYIDISDNNFLYYAKTGQSNINIYDVENENYVMIAYNNMLAGETKLTNAYLGYQNLSIYKSSKDDCDYEIYSHSGSNGYRIYVYPFGEICTGKDDDNNLIYKKIKCRLYQLNPETKVYEFVQDFNTNPNALKNTYEDYVPEESGYFKLEFLTVDNEPIYALDENYDYKTEKDYYGNEYKVLDTRFSSVIIKAKPAEAGNIYIQYKDKYYPLELATIGPVTLKLCSSIQKRNPNVTFKYLLNGVGQDYDELKEESIPFEGDEIYIDKTSYYTLTVWIVENGVESDFVNFALNISVPRKMTVENWIFLILGTIAVLGISSYAIYVNTNKKYKKDINDFEF